MTRMPKRPSLHRMPAPLRGEAVDPRPGRRLRIARQRAGLSLRELAERMGIPEGYARISILERGGLRASLDWLWLASQALGCDPHELDPRLTSLRRDGARPSETERASESPESVTEGGRSRR